jgi:hypothetical protein
MITIILLAGKFWSILLSHIFSDDVAGQMPRVFT